MTHFSHLITRSEAASLIRPITLPAIEAIIPPRDPFNIADPCVSEEGHLIVCQAEEVFCPECSRRFW